MAKRKEIDHVQKLVADLRTPPANDAVYGMIREEDPDVQALAQDIKQNGILEPLVVSKDGYVISGNRRFTAAKMLGLEFVPVRIEDVTIDDKERFNMLLIAFNKQRVKTLDQMAREVAASVDPEAAMHEVENYRKRKSAISAECLDLGAYRGRSKIRGNRPLADAAITVVIDNREWWPLSDRQIHYRLLNVQPLLHEKKKERYTNSLKCYRALTNILTRLRLNGEIPMHAISDDTRPTTVWDVHQHAGTFLKSELDGFLMGYYRDFMQSQPNHIEILGEKLTIQPILLKVANKYAIPLTTGRGFASIPPRQAMVNRWKKSGKDKLVVVIVSDFDPAGQTIAESFGRSLRDDFDVPKDRLAVIKAALTMDQIKRMGLPPAMVVKEKSPTAKDFMAKYGNQVWELEAVPPDELIELVEDVLHGIMDFDLINAEKQKHKEDTVRLSAYRKAILQTFDHVQFSKTEEVFI